MMNIYEFLQKHDIAYEACEHPAVFTCEQAEKLVPPLPGAHTKNLFLKERKGKLMLVVIGYEKSVDLKALGKTLEVKDLSFASPEKLKEFLGVEPGSATVLGLLADTENVVQVIIDEKIWNAEAIQCHPLVNTATLVISHEGLETFLRATNHEVNVIDVPSRKE
jgi:Ala-tRNA(Pro) deacylase